MDHRKLKEILTKTEVLGLDVQPLRDFIKYLQVGQVVYKDYEHIVDTLSSILLRQNFESNSQPVQVQMLLQQINQKLAKRLEPIIKSSVASDSLNMEVLNVLLDLKKEMRSIKDGIPNTQPQVINNIISSSDSKSVDNEHNIKLDSVFVNPLDPKEGSDIKGNGNVNIESKKGSNISDKLSKLRDLKKEGTKVPRWNSCGKKKNQH